MSASSRRSSKISLAGETIVQNPATLKKIGSVPNTDLAQLKEIFAKAREVQKIWAAKPFTERKKHVLKMRDYIVANAQNISEAIADSTGSVRIDTLGTEVIPAAMLTDWYAKNAAGVLKPQRLKSSSIIFFNKRNILVHEPFGVVGIISPWNYPLSIPLHEVIMGLMAGNAIILKVATVSVLVGREIEKIVAAGNLPDGLFSHVVGSGSKVADAFFKNGADKIFFTGSTESGKSLVAKSADTLTPLSLELGGKDPMIVLEDADLERATNCAAWAGYQKAGQSCGGVERVYVQEKIFEKFITLMARKTGALRHGLDTDHSIEIGAITTENQLKCIQGQIKEALKKGAKIIAESGTAGKEKGYFFPATLIVDVNHSMRLMKEETFGPVLPVMKFTEVEDAVTMANDSNMGLTASIWTKNAARAKELAHRLNCGVVTINDHLYTHGQTETPWLGWKESGIGVTHSALGLLEMTRPKLINWDILNSKRNLWWYPFGEDTYKGLLSVLDFLYPRSLGKWISGSMAVTKLMIRKMFTPWKV